MTNCQSKSKCNPLGVQQLIQLGRQKRKKKMPMKIRKQLRMLLGRRLARKLIRIWSDVNNLIMAMDPVNNKGFFMNTRNNVSENLKAVFVEGKIVLNENGQTIFDLLKKKAEDFQDDNFVPDEALFGQVNDFLALVKEMRSFVGMFARTGDPVFQRKWSEAREAVKAALNKLGENSWLMP